MPDPSIAEIIAEKVAKLGSACSEEDKKAIVKILTAIFVDKKSQAEATGFDKSDLELIYSTAVSQYEAGKYKEAGDSFRYLYQLDSKDPRFTFGYAASLHKQKKYEQAARWYSATSLTDQDNPYPWFHSADCYLQLKNYDAASYMLLRTIQLAGDKPEYDNVKQLATNLNEFVDEQLKTGINAEPKKEET